MIEKQLTLGLASKEDELAPKILTCEECRFEYPVTHEYWDMSGDEPRQPCNACLAESQQLTVVPPQGKFETLANTIAGQVMTTPGIQQLADELNLSFDGVDGIAEFVRREFHLAKGGSAVRFKYLKMITDLLAEASDRQQKITNLDLFTNEDLVALLMTKLQTISQKNVN